MDAAAVRALARRSLEHGGRRTSALSTEWDVAGDCEHPVPFTLNGKVERDVHRSRGDNYRRVRKGVYVYTNAPSSSYFLDMHVRCGRCAKCLRRRRRIWSARARAEVASAARTWFCTLTASPHARHLYELRAEARLRRGGTDFLALSAQERFAEWAKEMGRELTKYVKRVRKDSGAKLRCLWVFEEHKDGAPHIHGLVHEMHSGEPVRWRILNQWPDGHAKFNLLTDPKQISYVTKYISKSARLRIRASLRYGASDDSARYRDRARQRPVF